MRRCRWRRLTVTSIHHEDPFRPSEKDRSPARRFRGRLASPVSVWTSGPDDAPAGLTVGSLFLAEGEPSCVVGLINDLTDLFDKLSDSGRFVVHILESDHRTLADRFAGLWPSPGGLFHGLEVETTDWGPALSALENRAYCRVSDITEAGYQRLVRGEIERLDIADIVDPLLHFRGRYRSLER